MRLLRFDLDNETGERIRITLFDDAGKARGSGFFRFLELESPSHPAESQFSVDIPGVRWMVLLEKLQKLGAIAGIERLEPRGKLMGGGRIGKLRLGSCT